MPVVTLWHSHYRSCTHDRITPNLQVHRRRQVLTFLCQQRLCHPPGCYPRTHELDAMKFARYLQETQTAEWKKAYIDYRGLKKRITAVRKSQENSVLRPGSRPDLTESPRQSVEDHSDSSDDHGLVSQRLAQRSLTSARSARPTSPVIEKERVAPQSNSEVTQTNAVGSSKSQKAPSSREQTGPKKRRRRPTFSRGASSFPTPFAAPPTLQETRSLLSSVERSFLDALDGELDKIETFYLDREKEMTARAQLLHEQLHELTYHRKLYHPKRGTSA
ncbi:hypothetical protein BDZ89DRAFT_20160 [Hymenopellis radicata]|nr:hypothetical protein BDZ89DRAFT_20160 [Hymenopellis radicata]